MRNFFLYTIFVFLIVISISSCKSGGGDHSELYSKIFSEEERGFRGSQPGDTFSIVLKREPGNPKHKDEMGLVYEINLGEGREAFVEYYSHPTQSAKVLGGIVSNISLRDEKEALEFFREAEEGIRFQYGVPEGAEGDYIWLRKDLNIEIRLRLLDSREDISINYTFAQPIDQFL